MTKFNLLEESEISHEIREMRHVKPFTWEECLNLGIIHPAMSDQNVINSFRQLRTSLRAKMERFNSSIIVSSISPGGGASFTSLNLAAAFTFDHQKTALLVDCNFTKPVLAKKLKVEYEYGLKDYITGQVDDIAKIVYKTGIPRLRLVPSGRTKTNIVEFFTGEKMLYFLEEVRSRYPDRVILIDTPPIVESADTKILAEICDYILLVVPYKNVLSSAIDKTLKSIDSSKVVGMVLNN